MNNKQHGIPESLHTCIHCGLAIKGVSIGFSAGRGRELVEGGVYYVSILVYSLLYTNMHGWLVCIYML